MASNELATILARRRSKAGGDSKASSLAVDNSALSTSEMDTFTGASSSIAERIARLKQQNAVDDAVGQTSPLSQVRTSAMSTHSTNDLDSSTTSVGSSSHMSKESVASEPIDTSAVAAAQEAAGVRKASSKIQQLQGSLGINVNPFQRPGKPPGGGNRGNQRESIMSTGEEHYGNTRHAMGVSMPGMTGSAIPMPGLAKGGFRLPSMATPGEDPTSETTFDDSHTTLHRVAGPKRRGLLRPPPGAFRLPTTMGVPIKSTVEPLQPLENDVAKIAAPAIVVESDAFDSSAISTPSQLPVPVPAATIHDTPTATSLPVAPAMPLPNVSTPMKPYQIQDDIDPYAPKYEDSNDLTSFAPTGFPSALLANFSMDELTLDDTSEASTSTLLGPSTLDTKPSFNPLSSRTFDESSKTLPKQGMAHETLILDDTQAPSRTPENVSSRLDAATLQEPKPVHYTPSPVLVDSTPASTSPSLRASVSTSASKFTNAKPSPGVDLFGAANDDESSDSDWSNADNDDDSQSLFNAQAALSTSTVAASPPILNPSEVHESPLASSSSLFGNPSIASALDAPSPGVVQAPRPAMIPPAPYNSLFGAALSSSSESDSDDDGEGLFNTR
ncbi:hypothetical protein CCR75_005174 [Bremia lactucae]|uniref:Uncharacterized protein n=1 Tax=Bremia lactucae TaxID=4779 RepID=A0A976FL63_BRELC|nr:hypothetical protein CCR75_005174 [Bremia lactucae]